VGGGYPSPEVTDPAQSGLLALFVHDEVVLEVPEDDTAVAALTKAVKRAVADAGGNR